MNINLNREVAEHFDRLRSLAEDASNDDEQTFSSRASAMSALTAMLTQLTKTQESLLNMERMARVEQILIETVKEMLTEEQIDIFIRNLESRLATL